MYTLQKTGINEQKLFYRLDGEPAERHGAVGYLRCDYGKSGDEFWTTWFDNQPLLKSPAFKTEFNGVIDYLREASQKSYPYDGSFAERCLLNMRRPVTDTAVRFKIQTEQFSYYVRCQPRQGDYDFYCMAYDNRYLLPELAGKHELPSSCYSVLPSSGELVILDIGESGYTISSGSQPERNVNRTKADYKNWSLGVTRAQEEAMLAGSLFGWDTPAAKPWNYEQDGSPRQQAQPPKRDNKER
jgi:hypothetical protein